MSSFGTSSSQTSVTDSSLYIDENKTTATFLKELSKKYSILGEPLEKYYKEYVTYNNYDKYSLNDEKKQRPSIDEGTKTNAQSYMKYTEEFKKELLQKINDDEKRTNTSLSVLKEAVSDLRILPIDLHKNISYYVQEVCRKGDITSFKWLHDTGILQEYDYTHGLKLCVVHKYNDLAKEIYSLSNGNIDLHDQQDYNLFGACKNNDKNLAKWILSLDKLRNFNIPERSSVYLDTDCWNYVRTVLERQES